MFKKINNRGQTISYVEYGSTLGLFNFSVSSIKDFLVDCSFNSLYDFLMCINILLLALEILKFSSSGLILMSLQFSLFSISFYLCFP